MKTFRSNVALKTILLGVSLAVSGMAYAKYPEQSIRIIAPFAAGTGPDANAREAASELGKHLGVTVFVDNKPGAGGAIGNTAAAQSKADGYTLLIGTTSSLSIQPNLFTKTKLDVEKSFIPVSLLGAMSTGLIANANVDVKDLKDLIDKLKNDPNQFNFATMGVGTYSHLAGEWFGVESGTKPTFIPYSTTSPFSDLIAGQVDFMFDALPAAVGSIKMDKLKLIAITGDERHPSFPDVPTFKEFGIENYDPSGWQGLLAPAGTPAEVIKALEEGMNKIKDNKVLADKWQQLYIGKLIASSSAEFQEFIKNDSAKWQKVIKEANIRLD